MRQRHVATMVLALLVAGAAVGVAQQRAEERLQAGLYQEEVQGNLQRAISIYEGILADRAAGRAVAANAQLRIGICYEALGMREAQRAYQRVVDTYGDQPDVVTQARARLAALSTTVTASRGPVARRVLPIADTEDAMPAVDPSPDGRRVAYVSTSDGGVYVRDVASGTVQQVAPGLPGWNHFPVWSPDGRRLAFSEERGSGRMRVKIVTVATRETIVVPGTDIEGWINVEDWSKDGRYLVCDRSPHLTLIAVDDGAMTVLADSVNLGKGTLSPDGRFVTYALGDEGNAQVFVRPVAGGAPRQITSAPRGNNRPQWAPDGRAIAYQSPAGIWVVPMDGGAPTGGARLAVAATNLMIRRWTEAGLFYSQFTDAGQRAVPYQVVLEPATGRPDPAGVQAVPGDRPESTTTFAWSPDLQRIAFGHSLSPQVTVVSASPRSAVTWDLGRNGHPIWMRWSADGHAILYEPYSWFWRGEGSTVVALDAETGRVRNLFPRIMDAEGITLSADGRLMAYSRRAAIPAESAAVSGPSAGRWVEAVVVADTVQRAGHVVATMSSPGEGPFSAQVRPMISPRGDRVLFVRQQRIADFRQATPQAASLWVVDSDGRGARRLATAAVIQSAIWDPSGRFIGYTAKPEMADGSTVLRVLNLATGADTEIPLPGHIGRRTGLWRYVRVVGWSSDGSRLGMIVGEYFDSAWEHWVVQGLEEGGR